MRQSPEKPNLQTSNTAGVQSSPPSAVPSKPELSTAETQQIRQEKLSVIRQAIENGAYDCDNLLEKAMTQMLQKLDLVDDSPEILS